MIEIIEVAYLSLLIIVYRLSYGFTKVIDDIISPLAYHYSLARTLLAISFTSLSLSYFKFFSNFFIAYLSFAK